MTPSKPDSNGNDLSKTSQEDPPDCYSYFDDRIQAAFDNPDATLSFLVKFGDQKEGIASTIRIRGDCPEDALKSLHAMLSDFKQYEGTNTHDYPATEYFDVHFWPRFVYLEDIVFSETRIVGDHSTEET